MPIAAIGATAAKDCNVPHCRHTQPQVRMTASRSQLIIHSLKTVISLVVSPLYENSSRTERTAASGWAERGRYGRAV